MNSKADLPYCKMCVCVGGGGYLMTNGIVILGIKAIHTKEGHIDMDIQNWMLLHNISTTVVGKIYIYCPNQNRGQ